MSYLYCTLDKITIEHLPCLKIYYLLTYYVQVSYYRNFYISLKTLNALQRPEQQCEKSVYIEEKTHLF